MKRSLILAGGVVALGIAAAIFLKSSDNREALAAGSPNTLPKGSPLAQVTLPAELSPQAQIGKTAFNAVCAACHGENAAGRAGMGPPFINPIYQPGHHSDMAFQMAVKQGVRAHHWPFGNMPPQPGLTPGDVKNIVAYVRELQRANGIQ
ncbi:MAG: cytochrome c [Paracoccaceae bacterium]|nr:cytochrome c [Paracoccaceae bacterium]